METRSIRTMDELGRVALPMEMRRELGWEKEMQLALFYEEGRVLLQSLRKRCAVCGGEEDLQPVRGRYLCRPCREEIERCAREMPGQGVRKSKRFGPVRVKTKR